MTACEMFYKFSPVPYFPSCCETRRIRSWKKRNTAESGWRQEAWNRGGDCPNHEVKEEDAAQCSGGRGRCLQNNQFYSIFLSSTSQIVFLFFFFGKRLCEVLVVIVSGGHILEKQVWVLSRFLWDDVDIYSENTCFQTQSVLVQQLSAKPLDAKKTC